MTSVLILLAVTGATLLGDYAIKVSGQRPAGLLSFEFAAGMILYSLPAIGWFFLMKNHTLAVIGVMYSASTIMLLVALGVFVFKEPFGMRDAAGVGLAVLAVVVMNHK